MPTVGQKFEVSTPFFDLLFHSIIGCKFIFTVEQIYMIILYRLIFTVILKRNFSSFWIICLTVIPIKTPLGLSLLPTKKKKNTSRSLSLTYLWLRHPDKSCWKFKTPQSHWYYIQRTTKNLASVTRIGLIRLRSGGIHLDFLHQFEKSNFDSKLRHKMYLYMAWGEWREWNGGTEGRAYENQGGSTRPKRH